MAAIVGEKMISNSVEVLLEKLVSGEFVDDFRSTKLDDSLLTKLKKTLMNLEYVLYIDENKGFTTCSKKKKGLTTLFLEGKGIITRSKNINKEITNYTFNQRLDMLRCAVLEVENLFEEINTEALRCKVEADYETPTPSQVLNNNNSSPFNQFNEVINFKMEKLIERLEFYISREELGESSARSARVDESSIYGRDDDRKKLKHLLLSTGFDNSKVGIISIVGMGGIGKTSLAKLLYYDPEVREKFELKLWANISNAFEHVNDFSVFETILESIASKKISDDNLNIKKNDTSDVKIIYPKVLLVLDDARDAEIVNRIYQMDIFIAGEMGSRIIVTTRNEKVAMSMKYSLYVHYLRPLESEDCWSLIAGHAFGPCNYQQRTNLEEVGREIAKKCGGLPYIALALGNLLRSKISPDYWNYVLETNIWELTDSEVQEALRLSLHYLLPPLRKCFAYCSNFPKNSILEKKTIIQLWIAEGLVESSTSQECWEKVGEEYFDLLVSRLLIQLRSIDDEEATFEINNFMHELGTTVSSEYPLKHNFSYTRGDYDSLNKFDKLHELKGLHTFLALPFQEQSPLCLLSNKVIHAMLPRMKKLRVLSLSNYRSITEVPNSIGSSIYLRYLNLSHTQIERLPSKICKLYNLQFLLLSGCKRLTELPEDMGKLVNLLHLNISDTALREMPEQIAKLQNLQSLSDFVVSKHTSGLKVAELGKFPHLHGKLSISQLQNVNDPLEASLANMMMKERIDELALEWDCGNNFSDSKIQSVVLENLRPSTNLKSLTIKGYGGISFPNWLGDILFSNMMSLRISNCDACLWLPPLGQLGNLKELIIKGMQSIQTIGTEFYGSDRSSFQPFLSLETLHFEDMEEWEEWNLNGGTTTKFPSLKTLLLSKCPKLSVGNMPNKFPSLTELELRECPLLVQSMPSLDRVFRQLMFPSNHLQQLTIDGFSSPMSFPTDGLQKTLKFLIISNCENLEFPPHDYLHNHNFTSLEELTISYSCNSMVSFTLGALPVLKSLFIEGCKNLKSISIAEDDSEKSLSFLRSIKIWDCNELKSFTTGGLPTPNLIYIAAWQCEKLHSLPEPMNTLTNLQEMEIDNLPNLQSFVIDDLPVSLQELTVGSVGVIMWNTEPTWEHLTCLSVLRINGADTVKTLMGPSLPASLLTLCICGLTDTRIDGKWLQHLVSLQKLEIINAPKLKMFPKKGFPSSLSVLSMTRCPLLEASVRRKRGKEWRKIAHIPSIVIDDELIT